MILPATSFRADSFGSKLSFRGPRPAYRPGADGGLIGGASLQCGDFVQILDAADQ